MPQDCFVKTSNNFQGQERTSHAIIWQEHFQILPRLKNMFDSCSQVNCHKYKVSFSPWHSQNYQVIYPLRKAQYTKFIQHFFFSSLKKGQDKEKNMQYRSLLRDDSAEVNSSKEAYFLHLKTENQSMNMHLPQML